MMFMTKILCFGSAGKDIFFPTGEGKVMETPEDIKAQKKIAFELGAKYKIKERHESLGGCAANIAVGLSRLGVEASCAGSVGKDLAGTWICEELKKNNVNIDLISVEENKKSDMSAIVVDIKSADRVIFTSRTSSGNLKLDAEKTKTMDWFFISDIHGKWEESLEKIFELAKAENKKVAFNPREAGIREDAAEIIEAIGLCEVVFVNKDEAIEIVSNVDKKISSKNINGEKFLLEKLFSLEPKAVVITDGLRGAWAYNGKDMLHVEAQKVPAVDSTGAGDSFASGFLAAYIKEKDMSECLQWGIILSSSVVQHYGATEGLLNEKEILEKIKDIKIEKI